MKYLHKPGTRGTIRTTATYTVQEACVKLYQAMKGIGTDEDAVMDVLCSHCNEDRMEIKKKYKIQYKKDLIAELDSELSMSFGKFVHGLMLDHDEYLLECVHRAIYKPKKVGGKLLKRLSSFFVEGISGGEYILIGILCARSNAELKELKKAYKKKYGKKLEEQFMSEDNPIAHDVSSFILDMASARRDEDDEVDEELLLEDGEGLAEAKEEEALHELFTERSFPHLKQMFEESKKLCGGKTIEEIIEGMEMSVELRAAYKAVVVLIREGEAAYYADRVRQAVQGAGTDDETLIKVILLRAEVDMVDIMEEYKKRYEVEMVQEVEDDTGGDFKTILMRMLEKPLMLTAPPEEEKKGRKKKKVGKEEAVEEKKVGKKKKEETEEPVVEEKKVVKKKNEVVEEPVVEEPVVEEKKKVVKKKKKVVVEKEEEPVPEPEEEVEVEVEEVVEATAVEVDESAVEAVEEEGEEEVVENEEAEEAGGDEEVVAEEDEPTITVEEEPADKEEETAGEEEETNVEEATGEEEDVKGEEDTNEEEGTEVTEKTDNENEEATDDTVISTAKDPKIGESEEVDESGSPVSREL